MNNAFSLQLTPLARFLRYWLLFTTLILLPITIAIPWLDNAVAQANLASVALIAVQYGVYTSKNRKSGALTVIRGGVTAAAFAVSIVIIVAVFYVIRHAAPIPQSSGWLQPVTGIGYAATAHLLSVYIISRWWPSATNNSIASITP